MGTPPSPLAWGVDEDGQPYWLLTSETWSVAGCVLELP